MLGPADQEALLQPIVAALAGMPGVAALALGGSAAAGLADASSDLDVYVYWRAPLAGPEQRVARLRPLADPQSLRVNLLTWGLEDHLQLQGTLVELVYFELDALVVDVKRAYGAGLIANAYTTSFLYTLASNRLLHDPAGELAALQRRLVAGYPEPTRAKLVQQHPELLRFSLKLLRLAQQRGDLLFVQQARYELQATYFDLLFALNRMYHPGGKRLLTHVRRCAVQPADLAARWSHIACLPADDSALVGYCDKLIVDLCRLIEETP